jgi:hypothetical protein
VNRDRPLIHNVCILSAYGNGESLGMCIRPKEYDNSWVYNVVLDDNMCNVSVQYECYQPMACKDIMLSGIKYTPPGSVACGYIVTTS